MELDTLRSKKAERRSGYNSNQSSFLAFQRVLGLDYGGKQAVCYHWKYKRYLL